MTMTSKKPPIAIGADEAGFDLKEIISAHLASRGLEVDDFGVHSHEPVLYPDIALAVAQSVAAGKHEQAILICGTGIGVCITANKVPGIRAAVCHDSYSAQRARKSNDCQIMTLGARVVGEELAKNLVDIFLDSDFEAARSGAKVDRISEIEREMHPEVPHVSC
jgi:ribose 5-phosphate isomerase B